MEDACAQEQEPQRYMEIANKAKAAYSQHYEELVANLRLEHLEDFALILKADNAKFNKEKMLKDFQENLLKVVMNSMEKSWETHSIGDNIVKLEMLKEKFKDRSDPNWRPYGKTVEEQTLPIRMQRLMAERRFLKKQIDFQDAHLEDLVKYNEMCRKEIEEIRVQRSFIRDQMHRGTAELQDLKSEYDEMIGQILYKD